MKLTSLDLSQTSVYPEMTISSHADMGRKQAAPESETPRDRNLPVMRGASFLADTVINMKRETITKFSFTQEEIDAAIAAAPDHVDDPDCPYDTNDKASVHAYWSKAIVTFPGGHPHQDPLWRTKAKK